MTPYFTIHSLLGLAYISVISQKHDHKYVGLHLLDKFSSKTTRLACMILNQELLKIHYLLSLVLSLLHKADARKSHQLLGLKSEA